MKPHLSYWLLPSMADRDFFQNIINKLAKAYEAPPFEPHVTIYSAPYTPQDSPEALLQQATNRIQCVSLGIDTLLYTDVFTKTLFVQFHPSSILTSISHALRRTVSEPSDYVLNPHLSLIYKRMSNATKQHLVSLLHLPQSQITFDEVGAVVSSGRTQTPKDVESWNMIYRRKLGELQC